MLELTVNTYTDPKLPDVAVALNVLPSLPLGDSSAERMRVQGLEPWTHGLKGRRTRTQPTQSQEVTSAPANACTTACTKPADSLHSDGHSEAAPTGEHFADAVAILARLPLSDAE
ncbi:MAG: hypothetical protein ABII82_08990, partial [Verrucomicrobiota bacterium]